MHTHEHAQPSTTPPPPAPLRAIFTLAKDQLVNCDNGEVTATIGTLLPISRNGLPVGDPNCDPAKDGDVLSVQPDGTLQTRPAGTAGPFERAVVSTVGLIYRPKGYEGAAWIYPLVSDWPNK